MSPCPIAKRIVNSVRRTKARIRAAPVTTTTNFTPIRVAGGGLPNPDAAEDGDRLDAYRPVKHIEAAARPEMRRRWPDRERPAGVGWGDGPAPVTPTMMTPRPEADRHWFERTGAAPD